MLEVRNWKKGFGLVEAMVGVVIISLFFGALTSVGHLSNRLARENTYTTQAAFLLEEGMEAVRLMRDRSWAGEIASLTPEQNYYFVFTGGSWHSSSNNIFIDNFFERKFTLANVYRDGSDDIAPSGTLDPNTKKIVVTVSWWDKTATTSRTLSAYIANLFDN